MLGRYNRVTRPCCLLLLVASFFIKCSWSAQTQINEFTADTPDMWAMDSSRPARSDWKKIRKNAFVGISSNEIYTLEGNSMDRDKAIRLYLDRTLYPVDAPAEFMEHWYPVDIKQDGVGALVVVLQQFIITSGSRFLKPTSEKMQTTINEFIKKHNDIESMRHARKSLPSVFIALTAGNCGEDQLNNLIDQDNRFLIVSNPLVLAKAHNMVGDPMMKRDLLRALLHQTITLPTPRSTESLGHADDTNASMRDPEAILVNIGAGAAPKLIEDLGTSVPEVYKFLLWRPAIEIGSSFLRKPPEWLSLDGDNTPDEASFKHPGILAEMRTIPSIRKHLEAIVSGIEHIENITSPSNRGIEVFWHSHVVDGTVQRWILENAFQNQSTTLGTALEASLLSTLADDGTDNELKAPEALKMISSGIKYNHKLVQFKINHEPYARSKRQMGGIKQLVWPSDLDEIKAHLSGQSTEPIIIRRAIDSMKLEDKDGMGLRLLLEHMRDASLLDTLRAERENQFVWHSKAAEQHGYHVTSRWEKGSLLQALEDVNLQLVDSVSSSLQDRLTEGDSIFNHVQSSRNLGLRVAHAGSTTALHYDTHHSIFYQLEGAKDIILYSPDELENLYPYPKTHPMWRRCLADPEHPDPILLPKFNVSAGYYVQANRGDLVFWPPLWAHHIHTSAGDPSISIVARFGTKPRPLPEDKEASAELIESVEATRYAKGYWRKGRQQSSFIEIGESVTLIDDDDDPSMS